MIIFRYLTREICLTLAALVSILLVIFLSNQFVRYLARMAGGQMPGAVVFQLLMLEMPNLLGLLLPLALFIAILLAYGRLYAENEMTVLSACGFSQKQLLTVTMIVASLVTVIVAGVALWLGPIIAKDRDYLLTSGGAAVMIETIVPGRFRYIPGGNKVFYVEKMTRDHAQSEFVFLAERRKQEGVGLPGWDIVVAKRGYFIKENASSEVAGSESLVLEQGRQYQGAPGKKYQIVKFDKYTARLPQGQPRVRYEENVLPTSKLWPINNTDIIKAAELQWRLSVPLMTLLLAFLAVPLSRVKPRQGKYAKLLPSILIFMVYANMIFVARDWVRAGKVSTIIGVWWVHGLVLLLALCLFFSTPLKALLQRLKHKVIMR